MKVVVADYGATKPDSFLTRLETISVERGDGGLFHGGHIHFIQNELSQDGGFMLKASIQAVLDLVPSVFPYDLPEQVSQNPDLAVTSEQEGAISRINENLIIPLLGGDIVAIIQAAKKYEGAILSSD